MAFIVFKRRKKTASHAACVNVVSIMQQLKLSVMLTD